jgi:type III restriction enzyme
MTLRYLAPDDIDRDPDVRIVFFKASLNQGWDCPRAEVMMSYRRHEDATLIAQLVGRMVRAPLTRRIEEQDELNSVELFLPYFDEGTVESVRSRLEGVVPSDTETGTTPPATLVRAPKSGAFFKALEGLPTYVVPRVRKTKQTRRAVALAGLLDQHGLTTDCSDETVARLVNQLLQAQAARAGDAAFQSAIAEGGVIPVIVRAYDPYGGTIGTEDERLEVEASASRAEDLWRYAGRLFGASLHKPYVRARVEADGKSVVTKAKFEAAVLASDSGVIDALEATARAVVDELLDAHGEAIDGLDAAAAADFERIREQADVPVVKKLKLPRTIEVRPSEKKAPAGHVYVEKGTSEASFAFGTWERAAVNGGGLGAWLRNFDRRDYSLTIPYEMAGENRPLYPDILGLRKEKSGIKVDLLDPHNPDLPDAVPKAQGLAAYAKLHGHLFGRIQLIIKDGNALRRIDMKQSALREKVQRAAGNDALKQLFT